MRSAHRKVDNNISRVFSQVVYIISIFYPSRRVEIKAAKKK